MRGQTFMHTFVTLKTFMLLTVRGNVYTQSVSTPGVQHTVFDCFRHFLRRHIMCWEVGFAVECCRVSVNVTG